MDWKDVYDEILLSPKFNDEMLVDLKAEFFHSQLYKYRSFDKKGRWKLWLDGAITAAPPSSFNDPFDCLMSYDHETSVFLLKDALQHGSIISENSLTPYEKAAIASSNTPLETFADILAAQGRTLDRNELVKLYEPSRYIAFLQNLLRVTAFSEDNSSILMWGHYSCNHEGFCVQLDFSQRTDLIPSIYPVTYSDKRIFVTPATWSNNSWALQAPLVKATQWRYEQEWRLLGGKHLELLSQTVSDNNSVQIIRGIPVPAVYLGARCNLASKNVKKLLQIAEKNGTKVYKMKPHPTEFAVYPEQL